MQEMKKYSKVFLQFFNTFEENADFNSNKATYSKYLRDLERLREVSLHKPYYFKLPKYQRSQFKFIEKDIQNIEQLGKIVENQTCEQPLTIFNSEIFGIYEYRDK